MKLKIRLFLKRLIVIILVAITLGTAVTTSLPIALADYGSDGMLSTNEALGSPILNSDFTTDNWNKWEMVCWGVYLSNFCQPLIDNYESAFKEGAGGSEGAGYKALCFGSGSDRENNKVIKAFCDYAILQQNTAQQKNIYVTYTKYTFKGNTTVDIMNTYADANALEGLTVPDADAAYKLRTAKFNDFFFTGISGEHATAGETTVSRVNDTRSLTGYTTIRVRCEYMVPTFWIQNSQKKYIKILDYNDPWDIQMIPALANALRSSEYKEQFNSTFSTLKTSNPSVGFDVFGNILVNNLMLFPACVNQNITEEKSINLLNSWVFNAYNSTYSRNQLIEGLRQDTINLITDLDITGGLPAFSYTNIGNIGLLYYDLDSIAYDKKVVDGETKLHLGEAYEELFKLDVNRDDNKYPLKFEIAGTGDVFRTINHDDIIDTAVVASLLSNRRYDSNVQPEILHEIVSTNGEKISIFDSKPVVFSNQIKFKGDDALAIRHFFDYLYRIYLGEAIETSEGKSISVAGDLTYLLSIEDFDDLKDTMKSMWKTFKAVYPQFKKVDFRDFQLLDLGDNDSFTSDSNRLIKAYPVSEVVKAASSVLGCVDGTEYSVYSTMIYMTYLDWYGISRVSSFEYGTEFESRFNKEIYEETLDILKADPQDISNELMTEEEKEKEMLELGFLSLHPEAGRTYRKTLITNGLIDFMYEQYNRICFGGASTNYTGSASKSNSGFLAVEAYTESFLVAWFLESYTDIAVWLIGVGCIAVILLGLLTSKKLSWYFFSVFTIINIVLIVPSSGDIVPYITNNVINKMFSSKMTAWSMSEGAANASLEADVTSTTGDFEDLTDTEAKQALALVKQLNVVYADRSLMLKQDISQKLTQKLGGVYTEIQTLQSARWILPMVMQQFSNEQEATNSLYVKLSNVWDDASNLYWYYMPSDASIVTKPTSTSGQFVPSGTKQDENGVDVPNRQAHIASESEKTLTNLSVWFLDYVEAKWEDDTNTDINYACSAYSVRRNDEMVHTFSYMLPDSIRPVLSRKSALGNAGENYKDANSWSQYIEYAKGATTTDTWRTDKESDDEKAQGFEYVADTYDRANTETLKPGFSFYKTTESPLYYFFNVTKDTFPETISIGALIGRLQGEIAETDEGLETRSNFMYATRTAARESVDAYTGKIDNADVKYTPYIRDCLDLQNFFTNVVPYLYQMTIQTGGFDGVSGILGDLEITDESDFYKGNKQSWAYRCNWAVKLMENPKYSKPLTVRDSSGNTYTVNNPMLTECYPAGRPMIFSEAQMHAYNLKEADLNLVELKCIKVNKEVAKSWTLLLNYAGTENLTKEVLFRQMATDATQIFNREFSSGGILNNLYSLYPQSIDLRYLSFDSILKMLMMNVSKDTSYIYGDTMLKLITDTDLGTAFLLLIVTSICSYVVPFARVTFMALIFFLGFAAMIKALFSSIKFKANIACGQLISNLIFMGYTIVFYGCISGLMAITSSDEVLTVKSIESNPGNPVWMLLALLIICGAYIFVIGYHIVFCLKYSKDMGFEMYSQVSSAMADKIGGTIRRTTGKIRNSISSRRDALSGKASTSFDSEHYNSGTSLFKAFNAKGSTSGDTKTKVGSTGSLLVSDGKDKKRTTKGRDSEKNLKSGYMTEVNDYTNGTTANDINAEIEAGKTLEVKEKQEKISKNKVDTQVKI